MSYCLLTVSSLFSSAKVRLFFQSRNTFPPLFPPKTQKVDIRHSIPPVVDIGQFAARWHLLVWVKRRGKYCPAAKLRGTVAFLLRIYSGGSLCLFFGDEYIAQIAVGVE